MATGGEIQRPPAGRSDGRLRGDSHGRRQAPEPEPRWLSLEARDGHIEVGEAEAFDASATRRHDARGALLSALNRSRQSWAAWARAADVDPKDRTARRARDELERDGQAVKHADGTWTQPPTP